MSEGFRRQHLGSQRVRDKILILRNFASPASSLQDIGVEVSCARLR